MPLKKSKGNMYDWVDFTHCHLGGQCPHECSYCYVKSFPFRPAKYQGELRLIEKELAVNYGSGKKIFVENCNDIMTAPEEIIERIIHHCLSWPDNLYVFQSKNPSRFRDMERLFPENSLFGTTIESNRHYPEISKAPSPVARMNAIWKLQKRKFITIEPILDFDMDPLLGWLKYSGAEFINIGADSKKHNLPEPPPEKIKELISELSKFTEVRVKDNLKRIVNA